MGIVYSIRDWDEHFEIAQSKKVTGALTWFPMPTKHDGLSYRKIMARTDGPMIYAAWVLLLAVAAKCPVRGRLADVNGPYSAADMELKTGCPATLFDEALNVLSSKDIGWIVVAEWEQSGATGQDRTGQDKEIAGAISSTELPPAAPSAATDFVFPTAGKGSKEWTLTKAKYDEYVQSYPGLDVAAEMRKARQWCRDKPRQRKTPSGMQAFLTIWLNRTQNKGGGKGGEVQPTYEKVTAREFADLFRKKKFKVGPTRHVTDKSWVMGTLEDGRKVECKDYPPPSEQTNS